MSQQGSSTSVFAGASSSTYTKYASLPDVDTSAPDVYEYEGPDRANDATRSSRQRSLKQRSAEDGETESDSFSDDSDCSAHRKHPGDGHGASNEDIDRTSLRRSNAAAKFSGATDLNAESADYSGRLNARRTRKAKATRPKDAGLETTTYSIAGAEGTKQESVVDRLRRLKFEASQLEEELNANAANTNGETIDSKEAQGSDHVDSADVLAQLKVLQDQLAKLPSPSNADASTDGSSTVNKQAVRAMLQRVKELPSSATSSAPGSNESAAATIPASTSATSPDLVQLEARLAELESTLGIQEALLDETKPVSRPILSTLSRLEHQLSLLSQPRHLDAISRRVKVLVTEMDRVHDVRRKLLTEPSSNAADTGSSGSSNSTTTPRTQAELTKLQQLLDISTRLEPLLPILPSVLDRLQTLSDLHASAAHFGSALDELEEGREARLQQEEEMEELLKKMEVNMEENRKKVELNLEAIQNRIEEVATRLDKASR